MGGIRWYMVLWELQIKKKLFATARGCNRKTQWVQCKNREKTQVLNYPWAPEKTSKLNDSRLCGLFG
jgi:hypothetical protein